jgi:hypothetical protein
MTYNYIFKHILMIFLFLYSTLAFAATCPTGVDPTYCKLADATGGKVTFCPKDANFNQCMEKSLAYVAPKPPSQLEQISHETQLFFQEYYYSTLFGFFLCMVTIAILVHYKQKSMSFMTTVLFTIFSIGLFGIIASLTNNRGQIFQIVPIVMIPLSLPLLVLCAITSFVLNKFKHLRVVNV